MSIIQKLSEGIVNRDMKKEGQALLSKWEATGLLEGIDTQQGKHNMARLLENQAKELLRESNAMSNNGIEGFASVAFPIVRRVFAGLIANDLVSVQPMSLPSGLIFFLDFVYSPRIGDNNVKADGDLKDKSRFGNSSAKSIYGTDQVGSQVTGGVNIVGDTLKENLSGVRNQVGYAYGSPTGSLSNFHTNDGVSPLINGQNSTHASNIKLADTFILDGAVSDARKKVIKYDPDLLDSTDSSLTVFVLDITTAAFVNGDFENLAAFSLKELGDKAANTAGGFVAGIAAISNIGTPGAVADDTQQIRRLTQHLKDSSAAAHGIASSLTAAANCVRFILVTSTSGHTVGTSAVMGASVTAGGLEFPLKDALSSTADKLGAIDGFNFPFEGNGDMPEIDIKVDSIAITAQTKKLKAKWTPELGQDLNAYHNLDAEVELTSILSEQIALEIDRELLADLVNGATAATYYWSRSPGLFVNRTNGAELGANSAAPDFTGTVSEWYETLIETINDVSAQIHLKTLRGGANYIVCSPEVANILEFTSGYRANVTADADKGTIGAVKVGSLSRKFDIIVDPYFPRNAILVGRKGGSFLESGYVYAPYVPLQTTPTIFGVEDFVPRKGVMTRYGKKMVRPDMYGLVIVRGLTGEEYSS